MKHAFRHIATVILLLLCLSGLRAQSVGFSLSGGLGSSRMDDLKYLQEYILSTYPVEGKITSSFPPFTRASFNIMKEGYDYLHFGGGYSYATTGGKSSYADRTGAIVTEMDATSHRLGAVLSYSILTGDRLDLALHGRVDLNLTVVDIVSAVNILGRINRVYNQYRSLGPSLTAGLQGMYIFDGFGVGLEAGYVVDIPGSLKSTDGGDELTDPNDRERILTADWTGWYVGVKTRVWLNF